MEMVIGSREALGDPKTTAAALGDGDRLSAAGDRVGAVIAFRRAVHASPNDATACFKLAYALDLLGEEDEAISLYERVAGGKPAHVNALMNLAVLYEDRGEYVQAEKCLRQVLETNPTHARARLFMKDVQHSRGMVMDEEDRDASKRSALLDTPVTDFELSVRARNCLKKMNIRTLGDLLGITEAELMAYKNFGEASLLEIKEMLSHKGLRLGQGLEEQHRRMRRRVFDQIRGSGSEASLGKPVSDLGLSVRARKALQTLGVQTLGDLAARTEAELMGVKNFGATSLEEVKEKLSENGLSLRQLDF
jgi:DNA-directed RNA polymerase subunit alpha